MSETLPWSRSNKRPHSVTVVGAGLAGSELAFQLADAGIKVELIEQKPIVKTPAQHLDGFAELVCSNSFRGAALTNAVGLLKEEMRRLGSFIIEVGEATRVPAGGAFAVDRERFSQAVTERLKHHPNISVVAKTVQALPDATAEQPVVLATGPLTGDRLAEDLARTIGSEHLAYYDAIAPIVETASLDHTKIFAQSRYGKGETPENNSGGDDAYLNCPLEKPEYLAFVAALQSAEKVEAKTFEKIKYFEGCLPIEVMAERGERTLAFGPMKPVGLVDPKTGRRPYAVLQLRPEDLDKTAYNLVGFQTRMKWPEQKRVFAMIPGLENAEFQRFGSIHRNTFVNAPVALHDSLELRAKPHTYLAGQITGVEGYVESAACGLFLAKMILGFGAPPRATALGALYDHLRRPRAAKEVFQPSNVVFSMFPSLQSTVDAKQKIGKQERAEQHADRALRALEDWKSAALAVSS